MDGRTIIIIIIIVVYPVRFAANGNFRDGLTTRLDAEERSQGVKQASQNPGVSPGEKRS